MIVPGESKVKAANAAICDAAPRGGPSRRYAARRIVIWRDFAGLLHRIKLDEQSAALGVNAKKYRSTVPFLVACHGFEV
jgi:hypothetical protein